MARVNVLVITGYGTNCEQESAYAVRQAGADAATVVFFSDIAAGRVNIADFNYLIFPGGFLDGDDLGAAHAAAVRWRHAVTSKGEPLLHQLRAFLDQGGVVLGICNGFQLLVRTAGSGSRPIRPRPAFSPRGWTGSTCRYATAKARSFPSLRKCWTTS